ncbi:MAG: FHA domain-containing protein, partial [Anaerolineae bacterium]
MDCPSCHSPNADDARFCSACRHPLQPETPDEPETDAEVWIVGRSDQARVQIDLDSVSWEHLAVRAEGDTLWVRDLGSTNGTWILDDRVTPVKDQEVAVHPGGALLLGS